MTDPALDARTQPAGPRVGFARSLSLVGAGRHQVRPKTTERPEDA